GTRTAGLLTLSLTALLALSITQSAAKEGVQLAQAQPPKTLTPAPAVTLPPKPQPTPVAVTSAHQVLESRIRSIGQAFNGDIGIAVQDVQTGFTAAYDGNTYFPQQSVSKFWVALTALDRADRGHLNLEAPVTVTRDDLTLFHQPIAAQVGPNGYTTTLNSLMYRAITQSDNTCNDFVLWKAGGPDAVRSFLADKRISGVRFGPGERMLQARIAGMEWKPSMVGANFYAARNSLPMNVRRAAFENYIRDPMDGATPLGTVDALARLKRGELLSPQSTQKLLSIMSNTRTGAQRLKGGLAPGWRLAHKTGTGQVLNGTQAGYNDIGIVTGPDGRSYAVAVLIRRTAAPLPERMRAMQNVVRATIDYANAVPAERFAKMPARPAQPVQQAVQQPAGIQAVAATVQALPEEDE
ncbi:MAG TPA: class A beta-lactamase, partial [Allosphingosinicella sp.]|nr:class A beta-lactamase [Allosphingosinicella sp.]